MSAAPPRPAVSVRSVNCPNCGAATAIRTFGHVVNVVCQSCGSILDAKDPGVTIVQEYKKALREEPLIPLGTRGKLRIGEKTIEYEVVGFQIRQITVGATDYRWREYLLFNPYREFRYLTEYAGHWNLVSTLHFLPDGDATPEGVGPRWVHGDQYRHFQTAVATTVFVLGEFPWQVRVGEQATGVDYVDPPRVLSAEVSTDKEVVWSLGEYVDGRELWSALSLPGRPPSPKGVYANQPSPFTGRTSQMWRTSVKLIALAALLWLVHLATAREKVAFAQDFTYDPSVPQEAFVTPIFDLDGRPSAVRVETDAAIENQWIDVDYALVNDDTGATFDFAREVSYYHGVEGGETWSEGSRRDAITLPRVPAGRYFLRVEPEGDRRATVRYQVRVVRDAATSFWFLVAVALLVLPPIAVTWRAMVFERARWAESDHAPESSGDSSDGDDD
jgi:ribosomal protein S27E